MTAVEFGDETAERSGFVYRPRHLSRKARLRFRILYFTYLAWPSARSCRSVIHVSCSSLPCRNQAFQLLAPYFFLRHVPGSAI
jgi:hypothetical protein